MQEGLTGCERVLRDHQKIWPEGIVVRFKESVELARIVEVMAWSVTADFDEFLRVSEQILLDFIAVAKRAGVEFAFSARTVQLVSDIGSARPNQRVLARRRGFTSAALSGLDSL